MSWSRAEVTALIQEYRKWPNLYNVKSTNYKNRNLRKQALEAISDALKDVKPDITTMDIQNKFQSLKQTIVKEHKKWKNSLKSGAGEDEVYQPFLWYYQSMFFILEYTESTEPKNTLDLTSEDQRPGTSKEVSSASETPMTNTDSEDLTDDDFYGIVSSDGSVIVEEPTPEPCDSPLPSVNNSPFPVASHHSPVTVVSDDSITPKKKFKKQPEDLFYKAITNSLNTISEKLRTQSEARPMPFSNSENKKFCEMLEKKLDRIQNEEIQDEIHLQILELVNKAIKKSRESS